MRSSNSPASTPGPDQGQLVVRALKQALRARGVTYARLAQALGISEPSVKRVFSRQTLTLSRLAQICAVLEMDLAELVRQARVGDGDHAELSLEQETALAADPRLILVFHLLLANWRVADIRREYAIGEHACTRLLARLDRLKLIDLLPRDRVRVRIAREFVWRRNGPVRRRYGAAALAEFVSGEFEAPRELLRFETRELSEASLAVIRRKLERLGAEFLQLADLDAGLPSTRRRSCGMLLAIRPWVFSVATALKRVTHAKP